jgi:hypothetical protein
VLAAHLNEEHLQETECYLDMQALANSKELASKAIVCAVMLMKQEALNIAFGSASSMPPPYPIASALSTSSVMSTLSGHPPLQPRTPGPHAPSLGTHARTGSMLSRLGELRPTSLESAGSAIDLKSSIEHCSQAKPPWHA